MAVETAAAARAAAAPAQQAAASGQPMRRTSDSATPAGSLTNTHNSSNSISSSSSGGSGTCLLAVTGFGKFCGVTNNPSQTLVQRLPEFLRKQQQQQQQEQQQQRESRSVGVRGPSAPLAPGWELGRCCVLEVAGKDALPQLQWVLSHPWADHPAHPADQPHQGGRAGEAEARGRQNSAAVPSGGGEAAPSLAAEKAASAAVRGGGGGGQSSSRRTKLRRLVWLHLGVDSGSPCFAVEQRGVNEADFSCPDERGWQPWHQPICAEDGPITFFRETTLPAADMVQYLKSLGFRVRHSFSAGRFVCNYVYYQSLRHAATAAICCCDSCCSSNGGCACMSKKVALGALGDTAAEATAVHNGAQQSGCPPAATPPVESPTAEVSKQGSMNGSNAAPSASCCCGPTSNLSAPGAGGGCDGVVVERSALFVHVPSFSVIGEEAQLRFLAALIRTLTHSLTLGGSPTPLSSSPLQRLPTELAPSPGGRPSGEAAAAAALLPTRLPSVS